MLQAHSIWNMGLKGELNWHDLLLASALKTAEPAVFEWIERDRELFLQEMPLALPYTHNKEQDKNERDALAQQLDSRICGDGLARRAAVHSALSLLFPDFGDKLGETAGTRRNSGLHQRIDFTPITGRAYLERFLSGCLSGNDLPDQPTLLFIRDAIKMGVDAGLFQRMYLDNYKKLTGTLNKFIQFSELVPAERALQVCDVMLAWIAENGIPAEWPKSQNYYEALVRDVSVIARRSLEISSASEAGEGQEGINLNAGGSLTFSWLKNAIEEHGINAWEMSERLLYDMEGNAEGGVSNDQILQLRKELVDMLVVTYVNGEKSLLPVVKKDRFAIQKFIKIIQIHPLYENFVQKFVGKLLIEAENDSSHCLKIGIIMLLVGWERPAFDEDPPASTYNFKTSKAFIEKMCDMQILLPAFKRWIAVKLPDPVASRAFLKLKEELSI
jgi:hypothetical protein